ncbi:META domain-containing protein [Streptomyces sp. NPDC018031]|uniref:META domain-containing protein n=1 Tax=Streptomyces sp. NPDC018031 TaxID=3365033 RepID=UPI00378E3043
MKRHFKATYAAAAALACTVVLAACGNETGSSDTVGGDAPVTGVQWEPQSVTVGDKKYGLPSQTDAHISFKPGKDGAEGGESGGVPGCNHLGADVEVEGDTLRVRDTALTAMGCAGEVQRFEERFMEVFTGDLKSEVSEDGKTLTLTQDDGDRIVLTAKPPKPAKPLRGTTWQVNGLVDKETTQSLPQGTEGKAHLRLGKGGEVSGSLGCNTFTSEATVKDGRIEFGPIASTRKMCPDAVMQVENRVRAVLSGPVSYDHDDRRLSLTADSGKGLTASAK